MIQISHQKLKQLCQGVTFVSNFPSDFTLCYNPHQPASCFVVRPLAKQQRLERVCDLIPYQSSKNFPKYCPLEYGYKLSPQFHYHVGFSKSDAKKPNMKIDKDIAVTLRLTVSESTGK